MTKYIAAVVFAVAAWFCHAGAQAQVTYKSSTGQPIDVPYVPTTERTVNQMLILGQAGPNDVHYDLGSGDGRIVIAAARDFKTKKGIGVDIDPKRIAEANANAKDAKVTDRVQFIQANIFDLDFSKATLVTMYLLPQINLKLRPKILDTLKPGTRVVSHAFDMDDWQADKSETIDTTNIYLWIVPAKVHGTWEWKTDDKTYRLQLIQQFQKVSGTLQVGKDKSVLRNAVLKGAQLSFAATLPEGRGPQKIGFAGKVNGDTIAATVAMGGQSGQVTAKRVAVRAGAAK